MSDDWIIVSRTWSKIYELHLRLEKCIKYRHKASKQTRHSHFDKFELALKFARKFSTCHKYHHRALYAFCHFIFFLCVCMCVYLRIHVAKTSESTSIELKRGNIYTGTNTMVACICTDCFGCIILFNWRKWSCCKPYVFRIYFVTQFTLIEINFISTNFVVLYTLRSVWQKSMHI